MPQAHAGFDQTVAIGATVVLNGTRSTDADGNEITQSWSITSKPGGSAASLSSTTVMRPSFAADLLPAIMWSSSSSMTAAPPVTP